MSKKSKMKEREEASYIAPCEDVVVELPFMVKRVMRGRRPSNELCKQCICIELATNRLCCLAGWNKSKIPMIEAAIRGTYNIKVAQSEVHKVGNVCYTQYSVLSIATKAAHRKQISHSCQSLGEVKEELMQCFHRRKNLMKNQAEV